MSSSKFLPALPILLLLTSCARTGIKPASTPSVAFSTKTPTESAEEGTRTLLTYDDLMSGFEADSPVDEGAPTPPTEASPARHTFEGRLELFVENATGELEMLRGDLAPEERSLPPFDIEFVQSGQYLVPVQRGSVVSDHPAWNYIIGPGRVWQEADDRGYSRASFPFALVAKGGVAAKLGRPWCSGRWESYDNNAFWANRYPEARFGCEI